MGDKNERELREWHVEVDTRKHNDYQGLRCKDQSSVVRRPACIGYVYRSLYAHADIGLVERLEALCPVEWLVREARATTVTRCRMCATLAGLIQLAKVRCKKVTWTGSNLTADTPFAKDMQYTFPEA